MCLPPPAPGRPGGVYRTPGVRVWDFPPDGLVSHLVGILIIMSDAPHPTTSEAQHLAVTLRRRREELAEAEGARIGQGTVVHALTTHLWAGVQVPAVACHAAVDPLRLHPVAGPVTCRRCLGRSRAAREQVPGQTSLL